MRGERSQVSEVTTLAALARDILFDVKFYSIIFVIASRIGKGVTRYLKIELKDVSAVRPASIMRMGDS